MTLIIALTYVHLPSTIDSHYNTSHDLKCILITSATSGIGRSLARSLRALPSSPKVIAAGRRQDRLDDRGVRDDQLQEQLNEHIDEILTKYRQTRPDRTAKGWSRITT
jgi:NAD(P)-dependent dehydrogenase (short-subunit alcohol dehydrogenase family)